MKIVNNEETVMLPLAEKDGQIVATVQEFYKGETRPPPQLLEKSHLSSPFPPVLSSSQTFLRNSDLEK